ncbi:MAG TPA: GTPase [Hyphomicrobiaceae bacterium]|jgi:predicted GTPase|nr:GTPase [Hyphomicrobiaceae bacterium]
MSERGEATQRTRQGKAGAAAPPGRSTVHLRLALLAVALVLPTVSLVLLGSLWLWQHGYVLYWAMGTCIAVTGAYLLERRLMLPLPLAAVASLQEGEPGDKAWTPRQEEAWADVQAFAAKAPADRMTSRDSALNLGLETVELVAKRLHPERGDPLLQFTVPEALALIERTSDGLRNFILATFPLGDRVTVAQLMWLYRWRGAVNLAEKGYQLWRVVRMLNPLAAATTEVRERFTRQMYEMGREHLAGRVARAYVREVGRAAIDLYGGNLRVTRQQLTSHVSEASRRDMAALESRAAEPIRILVAGQTGAGKSSLINTLAGAVEAVVDTVPATKSFTTYKLTHEGLPPALIVDSPGLSSPKGIAPLVDAAHHCDMVLWVADATRPARDRDRAALKAIRERFAAQPNRRRPPILLVLTRIDALRPFQDWAPPYDLEAGTREKAKSIRAAAEAAGEELGFAREDVVPVRADSAVAAYNIGALWARMVALVPEAERARHLRVLSEVRSASGWGSMWTQAVNAGRVLRDTLAGRDDQAKS